VYKPRCSIRHRQRAIRRAKLGFVSNTYTPEPRVSAHGFPRHVILRIATAAQVDPRSAARVLAQDPRASQMIRERVAAALSAMGLKP
jgi:hypothetical protein